MKEKIKMRDGDAILVMVKDSEGHTSLGI